MRGELHQGRRLRARIRPGQARVRGPYVVRHGETALEATYLYQVVPSWRLQRDVQYTSTQGADRIPAIRRGD